MDTTIIYKEIQIEIGPVLLKGHLRLAENSKGIVLFSHGSGSSRLSRRNNYVADFLNVKGISSLLFDLLTEEEDRVYRNRFDIDLLTDRLVEVTRWVQNQEACKKMPIAYFGASTGAASALRAAAIMGDLIKAIVSRGGRPDLAIEYLDRVKAPTLFVVGQNDPEVIKWNEQAHSRLAGYSELKIVPGASHLFEEPGKLQIVSKLACAWFHQYLKNSIN